MANILNILKDPGFYMIAFIGRVFLCGSIEKDAAYLKLLYKYKTGKKLDLNDPKTFNEKLQWLKLYDRKPIYTTMVDKYEAKKYIAKEIGEQYIIPTLGIWDRFEDINFETLPDKFVLKCTHNSGCIAICHDKSKFNYRKAKKKFNAYLKRNYYYSGREWPYKNVKPRIIAEKYMQDKDKIVPEDYKVYCMNGVPRYIVVFHNRFDKTKRLEETVYDTDWNKQNFSLDEHFAISDITEQKPKCLDELLYLTKKLCKNMSQVRLDFYIIENRIYFGEITLHTAGGFQKMIPEETDLEMGKFIKLPKSKSK